MTTVEVLRAARALYEGNPSHVPCGEWVPAGCYCPLTALSAVTGLSVTVTGSPAYMALCDAASIASNVAEWNAKHTTDEVLAAFDRAIEAAA